MKNGLLLAVLAAALAGCAAPPTTQQVAADYGPPPPADYEARITSYMARILKDPESARYTFRGAPKKAWYSLGGQMYGWAVCADINAKNSYGGYTGSHASYFLFRDGYIVKDVHDSARSSLATIACRSLG